MTAVNFLYDVGAFPAYAGTAAPSANDHSVNAATREVGMQLYAGTTNPITHIGFRLRNAAGTPPIFKVSIQGNSSGFPDGTIKGGGSPASGTFDPNGWAAHTTHWVALDNSWAPSSGTEIIWVVIEHESGTIDASNNGQFVYSYGNLAGDVDGVGLGAFTSNNWSSKFSSYPVGMAIRTATERIGTLLEGSPVGATNVLATNGHRGCGKFVLPVDVTVSGVVFSCDPEASGALKWGIWNAAGTELTSGSPDATSFTSVGVGAFTVSFAPITLSAGTTYYAGMQRTGAVCGTIVANVADADDRLMFPLGTSSCYSLWNGSSWADTTTQVPLRLGLIVSDVSTGGGVLSNRGILTGGRM